VAYRVALTTMTLSDLEGQFCCLNPFCLSHTSEMWHALTTMRLQMNRTVHVACNFNRLQLIIIIIIIIIIIVHT